MISRFAFVVSFFAVLPWSNYVRAIEPSAQELDPEQIPSILASVLEKLTSRSVELARVSAVLQSDWHHDFAKALDPTRHYFLDEDFSYFKELAKSIPRGTMDFEFAKAVQERLVQRVADVETIAGRWLAEPHDFTVDEFVELKYEGFAADSGNLSERWRKRIKLELLGEKLSDLLNEASTQAIGRRFRVAFERHRTRNDEELVQRYINTLLRRVDPHAWYMGPDEMSYFESDGHIIPYSLGLHFVVIDGELEITQVNSYIDEYPDSETLRQMNGMRLVAVRTASAEVVCCGDSFLEAWRCLCGSTLDNQELGDAVWVTLELRDPYSRRRWDLEWPRRRGR